VKKISAHFLSKPIAIPPAQAQLLHKAMLTPSNTQVEEITITPSTPPASLEPMEIDSSERMNKRPNEEITDVLPVSKKRMKTFTPGNSPLTNTNTSPPLMNQVDSQSRISVLEKSIEELVQQAKRQDNALKEMQEFITKLCKDQETTIQNKVAQLVKEQSEKYEEQLNKKEAEIQELLKKLQSTENHISYSTSNPPLNENITGPTSSESDNSTNRSSSYAEATKKSTPRTSTSSSSTGKGPRTKAALRCLQSKPMTGPPPTYEAIAIHWKPDPTSRKEGAKGQLKLAREALQELKVRHLIKDISLIGRSVVELFVSHEHSQTVKDTLISNKSTILTDFDRTANPYTNNDNDKAIVSRLGHLLARHPKNENLHAVILKDFDERICNLSRSIATELLTKQHSSKESNSNDA
jgi:ribosomal protein L31E